MLCGYFFQAEDGIRDLVRSRGLGDVYKRQLLDLVRNARIKGVVFISGDMHAGGIDSGAHSGLPLSLIHI